ncbi:MAG: twin-arginine translocase TatA/TatE family subunit [Acidimicrobiales bacterium]
MMAVLEGQEWLVVTGVGVLLFGGAWLPGFIRSLGRFRAELQAAADDGEPDGDPAAAPAAPGGSAALVGPGPGGVDVRPSLDRVEPQAATPLPETVPPSESVPPPSRCPPPRRSRPLRRRRTLQRCRRRGWSPMV